MADPGNPSPSSEAEQLSPAELDVLEDALERWTGDEAPVPEDSLLAPSLRARLEDYRGLLALTRAELPLEEVPDGLLASVLAEAHQSARAPAPPSRREVAGPGLWERLRRSMLVPGVALAGTAVMLLWIAQPVEDAAPTLSDRMLGESQIVPTPAQLSPDRSPAPAAAREPEAAALVAPDKDEARAPGGAADAPADAPADEGKPDRIDGLDSVDGLDSADSKAERPKPAAGLVKGSKKAADALAPTYPGLDDAPPADADKEALRDTLELADTARRKGRCGEALDLYLQAMGMSGAESERARARAGYGLCLMQQGDDRADRYFDAAHKLWPGVGGWIARERGDGPSKKAAPKPSSRAKMEAPSPLD